MNGKPIKIIKYIIVLVVQNKRDKGPFDSLPARQDNKKMAIDKTNLSKQTNLRLSFYAPSYVSSENNLIKQEMLIEKLKKENKKISIFTYNKYLSLLSKCKRFADAENVYDNIPEEDRTIVTKTTMLKVYADQGKYEQAEKFYQEIPVKDRTIVTKTTMLQVYADQGKYDQAEKFYVAIPEKDRDLVRDQEHDAKSVCRPGQT